MERQLLLSLLVRYYNTYCIHNELVAQVGHKEMDILYSPAMMNYEKSAPLDYIEQFLALKSLHKCRVEPLPAELLAIVACQMINVSAIPIELEQ